MKLSWAFLLVSHVFCVVAASQLPKVSRKTLASRKLQNTNFRATYKARYQHLVDETCTGPPPVVQVFCKGDITPVSISDASIKCSMIVEDSWNGMECSSICEGTGTCEDVYLETSGIEGGVFGEITFQCSGETTKDVDAAVEYNAGEPGSCEQGQFNGRNFHVAQMGVQCTREDGTNYYSYDDAYFECGFSSFSRKYDDKYTCIQGMNCEGESCQVVFADLSIEAEAHRFHECIESVSGVLVPEEATDEELRSPSAPGNYEATFEAKWQLYIDTTYCGTSGIATKRLTCIDGTIELVERLYENMNCSETSESILECTDTSGENFVNSFSGVVYKCHANQIPESRVEFLPGDAACQTETMTREVAHLIQLGVLCEDPEVPGEVFLWDDDYSFECGEDNDFELVDGVYTCRSSLTFPAGSQATDIATIPQLDMFIDPSTWARSEFESCYKYTSNLQEGTETAVPCKRQGIGIGIDIGSHGASDPGCATTAPTGTGSLSPVSEAPAPATTFPPTPVPSAGTTPDEFTTYKATYSAKFQHYINDGCEGPPPELTLLCFGGEMQLVETSDPSIDCVGPFPYNGSSIALCSNSCVGVECEDVYIDRDGTNADTMGEIIFECMSSSVDNVLAYVEIPGSDTGTCDGFGNGFNFDGVNIMIGKLGVLCPTGDVSDGSDSPQREYIFDDQHMECLIPSLSFSNFGDYECLSGRVCGDNACTVTIEDISIMADHFRFPECIESSDGSVIPDISLPSSEPLKTGTYSAEFSSNVRIEISPFSNADTCILTTSGQRVTCLNGGVRLFDYPDYMFCEVVGNDVIECAPQSGVVPADEWGSVVYECTSSVLPTTKVELFEVNTTCSAESQVQLGVLCGDPPDEGYWYHDILTECGEENEFGTIDGNYTCKESAFVSSFSSQPGTISQVDMYTDYRWSMGQVSDNCYTFKEGTAIPASTTTPSPVTTPAPVTNPATVMNSASPSTPTPNTPPPTPTPDPFRTYEASYSARYTHILTDGCDGPPPELFLACYTGELAVVETSHSSINCIGPFPVNGSSLAICSNSCTGNDCESVYISNSFRNMDVFGEIKFTCQGSDVDDVRAYAGIFGNETETCSESLANGFNYMQLQLGVECGGELLFDDEHTECVGGFPLESITDGEYNCLTGQGCGSSACSFTMDSIEMQADHFRFPECIQSSDGSAIPPIDLPTSQPIQAGTYTALFSSKAQIELSDLYDEEDCSINGSGQRLTCLNGVIRLLESPAFLTCYITGDDTLECLATNGDTPVNEWDTVIYECRSNEIPATKAELFEVETTCSATSQLQLGALCGDPPDASYLYLDGMIECGEGNDFKHTGNYSCTESVVVSSFANEPSTIPQVEVYTDYRWSLYLDVCYTYKSSRSSTAALPKIEVVKKELDSFKMSNASP